MGAKPKDKVPSREIKLPCGEKHEEIEGEYQGSSMLHKKKHGKKKKRMKKAVY